MTQIFYSSTFFGAMTLAAAIDDGLFGAHTERRLLITSVNSPIPEISSRVETTPGFAALRDRFDSLVCWNDIIAPQHPSGWAPPAHEVPMLSRLLYKQLEIDDVVSDLAVESIAVAPARTIATLIGECPITVFSDGLMSYGPTRDPLPDDVANRVRRLLYLGLVPSLEPLLLREYGAVAATISDNAFSKVIAELPAPTLAAGRAATAPMIVGQYLSALDIVTADEESRLYADMLRALAAQGHHDVVFKPHPAAGLGQVRLLRKVASALNVTLTVAADAGPAEAWFAHARPDLVVSCFSTALLTARHFFDLPIATMGCEIALERITPYENSNRIPATIVDATVPAMERSGQLRPQPPRDVAQLVSAVGYCMQARRHPDLRAPAEAYLAANGPARYFKTLRLEVVGLATPPFRRSRVVKGLRSRARQTVVRGQRFVPARWQPIPAPALPRPKQ